MASLDLLPFVFFRSQTSYCKNLSLGYNMEILHSAVIPFQDCAVLLFLDNLLLDLYCIRGNSTRFSVRLFKVNSHSSQGTYSTFYRYLFNTLKVSFETIYTEGFGV